MPSLVTARRPFPTLFFLAAGLFAAAIGAPSMAGDTPSSQAACAESGRWLDPASGEIVDGRTLFAALADKAIVLLGEQHTARDHHLWQMQTISGLKALKPDIVLGFEMFPRSVQGVLDDWTAGRLERRAFLSESRWSDVWGYDPDFYMPMFDFARLNRTPMVALNVDRGLIAKVGRGGWDAVAEEDRQGISDPAPASASYRDSLAQVYLAKMRHGVEKQPDGTAQADGEHGEHSAAEDLEDIQTSKPFDNFVQAQITWDRAMAEALAAAKERNPDALVIGVMGRGHIEYGHGVPHQLADLGLQNVAALIPVAAGEDCEALDPALADAVFLVDPTSTAIPDTPKPRLGVIIEPAEDGIRILRVSEDSIAEAARLAAGDVITTAAGVPVRKNTDLVEIIQRQAPGTWLPLDVRRDDETLSVLAKFPPPSGAPQ